MNLSSMSYHSRTSVHYGRACVVLCHSQPSITKTPCRLTSGRRNTKCKSFLFASVNQVFFRIRLIIHHIMTGLVIGLFTLAPPPVRHGVERLAIHLEHRAKMAEIEAEMFSEIARTKAKMEADLALERAQMQANLAQTVTTAQAEVDKDTVTTELEIQKEQVKTSIQTVISGPAMCGIIQRE